MSAAALLDRLRAAGVRIVADLALEADAEPPADLLAEVEAHKAELLATLAAREAAAFKRGGIRPAAAILAFENNQTNSNVDASAGIAETLEERAAILEHDAGLPRAWAEGAARLLAGLPPPNGCAPRRWQQVCDDAAELIRAGWPASAAALGWDAAEVFGASPTRPEARYDAQGLAWLICGGNVVDLDDEGATIVTATGRRLRFHRRPAGERHPPVSVPAWDLPAEGSETAIAGHTETVTRGRR